jgi:hypothetical protein
MTKTTIRTLIKQVESGVVYMRCEDQFVEGKTIERTFTVRRDGERGYVFETLPSGDRRQVFEKLGSQGSPLRAHALTLIDVIRREHRKVRAADANRFA